MSVKVAAVAAGSICDRKGIRPGDMLCEINGNAVNDVLDYRFYLTEKKLKAVFEKQDGRRKAFTIRKDETDDIGLEFETYLMDKHHSCKNKCIFCFVDQLPDGMRDSLYFKDDDDRLSFLFGNYVTLTNLDDEEVARLIKMRISPINVSVHTMNPELRVKMMANPESGKSLRYLKDFADAGLTINAQLVLCPGINDGDELVYSLEKLFEYYPAVGSIACVPVGLTKHRDGLCPLKPYDTVTAGEVIDIIDRENEKLKEKCGVKIAYASDEFYITAGRSIPPAEYYDDFPQLDNGVGMWALLKSEFEDALADCTVSSAKRKITVATGTAAYPLIDELCSLAQRRIPGLEINVIPVVNNLFGESVTVSGLLSGGDIYEAVKDTDIGDELIIPPNCLRNEGDMFIDSMTVEQLSDKLGARIRQNKNGGAQLLAALLGE